MGLLAIFKLILAFGKLVENALRETKMMHFRFACSMISNTCHFLELRIRNEENSPTWYHCHFLELMIRNEENSPTRKRSNRASFGVIVEDLLLIIRVTYMSMSLSYLCLSGARLQRSKGHSG